MVDVLNMPDNVKFVFLDIGLGLIIFTCVLGQLSTQVFASHSMIDYINNYFALFTLYMAIFIEFTGVMHSAYLIQYAMAAASGKAILSNEEVKSGFTKAFFWGRVLMSVAILGFSLAVVLVALFNGDTMFSKKYPSINPALAVFIFFASRACRSHSSPLPNFLGNSVGATGSGRRSPRSSSPGMDATSPAS
jgi:hypothetical protein